MATVRGLKAHSGKHRIVAGRPLPEALLAENPDEVHEGGANLRKQLENMRIHGCTPVVAINVFPDDHPADIAAIEEIAAEFGARSAVSTHFSDGGAGAKELAVGWDRGRRHETSLDQYVPFTAHVATPDGATTAFGVMLPPETAWVDVERVGDLEFVVTASAREGGVGLRLVGNGHADAEASAVNEGPVRVRFHRSPDTVTVSVTPVGHQTELTCSGDRVEAHLSLLAVPNPLVDEVQGASPEGTNVIGEDTVSQARLEEWS